MVRILALVALLAFAFTVVPVEATLARNPTAEVREIFLEANRALTDPATEDNPGERVRALLELLDRVVAFGDAAELALGREWRSRSVADQAEFLTLFTEMVERSLVMTVASRMKLEHGIEIRYLKESINGRHAVVTVAIVGRNGHDIPVEFRMVRRGDAWAIRDVAPDGLSLMGAYRAQFARVLRTSSFADLIARMKARNIDVPDWWAAIRTNGGRPAPQVVRNSTPAAQPPKPPAPIATVAAGPVGTATASPSAETATGESPNGVIARPPASADDFSPPAPDLIAASAVRAHAELVANGAMPASRTLAADPPRPAPPTVASSVEIVPETPRQAAPATRRSMPSRSREVASARPESPALSSPSRPAPPAPSLSPPAAPRAMTPPPSRDRPGSLASSPAPERRIAALPDPQQPTRAERAADATRWRAGVLYWVQIGLFENQKTAVRLLEELLTRKLPVEIGPMQLRTTRGPIDVTRVRVGPYPDRAAAAAMLGELKRSGYAPMLSIESASSAPAR